MPGMGRGEDSERVCDLGDFGLMNAAVQIVVMVLLGKEGVLEETLTVANLFFVMSIFFFCPIFSLLRVPQLFTFSSYNQEYYEIQVAKVTDVILCGRFCHLFPTT